MPVSNAWRGLLPVGMEETVRRTVREKMFPSKSTRSPTPEERRAARAADIAAAEAECRAAIAAITPSRDGQLEVSKDPRCMRAIAALTEAITLDEDDQRNFTAYLRRQETQVGNKEIIIKIIKRWPRIRNYWPRIRRRICWGCGKQYDLSEPRLWVCGGCLEARYCSETCQGAHWPEHKTPCVKKYFENVKKRRAQGESVGLIRQELLEWYGLPWPVG